MLLILSGKSGSGKDIVTQTILNHYPNETTRLVAHTSRPIRPNETNGKDYYFLTKEEFQSLIQENRFIEYRSFQTNVNGIPDEWFYGTMKFQPLEQDKMRVVIKDLAGAKELKEYCDSIGEVCVCILIEVNETVRTERAKQRSGFDQMEWDRRLKTDEFDFSMERQVGVVDYTIRNDEGLSLGDLATKCIQIGMEFETYQLERET